MPERETAQAFADAAAADAFLVVGSSLVVYPAAGLPRAALENGAPLVVVNREPTPYDEAPRSCCTGARADARRDRRADRHQPHQRLTRRRKETGDAAEAPSPVVLPIGATVQPRCTRRNSP